MDQQDKFTPLTPSQKAAQAKAITNVEDETKALLMTLFQLSVATHGYSGPETATALSNFVQKMPEHLSALVSHAKDPNLPSVPQELVEYVDEGRNPDVYTRQFVELTVRGNQALRGKGEAFKGFADVLRETLEKGDPEGMGKILKESQ